MVGRPINENRKLAVLYGDKTYHGSAHGCGTTERYVKGGGCVHCARETALAQREALREKTSNESRVETLDKAAPPKYAEPWD